MLFPAIAPHPFRSVTAIFCGTVLLSACASGPDSDPILNARMKTMFEAIYTETANVHIDPVDLPRFTRTGLSAFKAIDTALEPEIDERAFVFKYDDEPIFTQYLTVAANEPTYWADMVTQAVRQSRIASESFADLPEEDYYETFADAALAGLDRFSRYANPRDAAALKAERVGFGGIGIEIESHPDGARIEQVEPGKPAAAAGLVVGDRIAAIDGSSIRNLPLRTITEKLRGPVDTAVSLTIRRDGLPNPLSVEVGRTQIVPNTVFLSRINDHAVIRISSFNERTSKRLAEAVSQARSETGTALTGLILDLRGNLGGLLDQAVDSADLFLDAGLISRADGRHPRSHQRFEAEPGDVAEGLPVVVLINGASASAAEILAAALQDHGRAVLVGMNSFGKGSIQTVIDMPNGGELYITWARFMAPSGYALDRLGIMPTVCTSGATDAVTTLNTALSGGPDGARTMLDRRRRANAADEKTAKAILSLCPWRPHASGDIDIGIAELLLDSPALMRRALDIGRFADAS
ncbi:PDZ domain-containing protein [Rhodospirillaceae bacterium KN72]|uniref:PDZ domain-containing protein n=1 Tax=Pacificispira spongiicola TaxID=2729598 RepID=A0A7Y0HFQ6_9PROT|nr:S41 family peptidase [Pacificispira spongiicola]NMM44152.1 PDZ domain-containing protein [Pacificispira spongiicola]